MAIGEQDTRRDELVIVRRRPAESDEGHHGGVWKIAYADFMTAMMAFFLVMWLVNAASKDAKSLIASYFNPLRMSETLTGRKGLQELQPGAIRTQPSDVKAGSGSAITEAGEPEGEAPVAKGDDARPAGASRKGGPNEGNFTSEELFSDPYGVLARIGARLPPTGSGQGAAREKGTAFRDPFEPGFRSWQQEPQDRGDKPVVKPAEQAAQPSLADTPGSRKGGQVTAHDSEAAEVRKPWAPVVTRKDGRAGKPDLDTGRSAAPPKAEVVVEDAEAKRIADQIRSAVERFSSLRGAAPGPDVSVAVLPAGLLVSLTDKERYSMFESGSAVPRPRVVRLIETIARTIEQLPGKIVISGHTDAQPFRSGSYDNWRLSTDRAHAAYHMLVLGGVDPKRIVRVEGHAYRRPRNGLSPLLPENRRIEILIQKEPGR
jgi:chemotaxis protein MotB